MFIDRPAIPENVTVIGIISDTHGLLRSQGENTQSALRLEFTSEAEVKKSVVAAYVKQAIAVEKAGLKVDFKAKRDLELPEELTAYIRDRKGYDYLHHAEVGSSNAEFVSDEIVDRFALVGPADEHIRRLEELASTGVTQFNIYLMSGDEEETVEVYGREILPHFIGR